MYGTLKTYWFRIPKLKYIFFTLPSSKLFPSHRSTCSVILSCPLLQTIYLITLFRKNPIATSAAKSHEILGHIAQWDCRETHIGVKMQQNEPTTLRISKFFPQLVEHFAGCKHTHATTFCKEKLLYLFETQQIPQVISNSKQVKWCKYLVYCYRVCQKNSHK